MEAENILYNNYPCLAYLDYNIIHTPSSYQISLYQKEQQSLRMLHYTSHITNQVKRTTLLYYLRRVIYRTSLEYLEKDLVDCISMILINEYPFTMVQNVIQHITLTYMHQKSTYIQMPTTARLMILKKYIQPSSYPGLHDVHPRPRRYRRSIVISCNEISQVLTQNTNMCHPIH
ncbi:uncharacterized protein LOC119669189 [Teleopsis dalmanni]|uniref:uncharacterized protein LOC119669189 n=1 Tax=Teleopsis dalmanni TaxID=139649 RepID=UPI0018CD41BC|nr:uncharacterized protein LOC119669189 [Teleopsis dalmanni]